MGDDMKRFLKISALLGFSAILGACTMDKAGCDPRAMRDAGLLTKMNCDFSGSYDARAKDKEAQLASERQTNALLRQAVADMEKKNTLVNADVAKRRADITNINRSVAAYLRQVQNSNPSNQVLTAQVNEARARLDQLQKTPITTGSNNAQELRTRIQAVEIEVEKLRKTQAAILE
jgi:hypothetical protein